MQKLCCVCTIQQPLPVWIIVTSLPTHISINSHPFPVGIVSALIWSTMVGEHCSLTIANTCHVTSSHTACLLAMRQIWSFHRSTSSSLASSSGKGESISSWKLRSSGSIAVWNSLPPLMLQLTKSAISRVVLSNRSFPPRIPPHRIRGP